MRILVRFPDQSPSFAHGFEAGQWAQRLEDAARNSVQTIDTRNGFPIHVENEIVIGMIAKDNGFRMTIHPAGHDLDDIYSHAFFERFEDQFDAGSNRN